MGRYEQGVGEPDSNTLALIAEELRVSPDYLLGGVDTPNEHLSEVDPEMLALAKSIMELPEHMRTALIGIIDSMKQARHK